MKHSVLQRRPAAPLAAAIVSVLVPGIGLAAAASDGGFEEIVVTATRRETTVLDVPYNISAVLGTTIEANHVIDNPELLRSLPGIGVVDRGYRNSGVLNSINMRGLNVDGAALGDYAVSTVGAVSTYVNDTPLLAGFLLRDLERVEVLRGPQGTLYGSGSMGGTVRYILRKPELEKFSTTVRLTGSQVDGSNGTGWGGDLMLNVPLGETFALRINASRLDYPGLTDYVNLYQLDDNGIPVAPNGVLDPAAVYTRKKDADTVDIWSGRASLYWQPSDTLDFTLTFAKQTDEIGGRRQQTVGFDGFGRRYKDYENGSIQLEPSSRDVEMTSLEANIDLGFATLTSSSSYYDHGGDSISENTGFYAQAGFLAFYYNYPRPMASAVRTYGDRAFVQELRLASNTGGKFDYVAGLYYMDQDLVSTQDSYLRGFKAWWDTLLPEFAAAVISDRDFIYRRHEEFTDKAVFGELTYHVTDRLALTAGARHFKNDSENRTFMDVPLYASLSDPTNAFFENSESKTLFKGNVSWDVTDDMKLYATVSEGYRRGGSNAVPLSGNFVEDPRWQPYGSDSIVNYEVGFKGKTQHLQFSTSIFFIDWEDVQINTSTPNWGFFVVQNGGKAESKGIEAELQGWIGSGWHYAIGGAYTDAELSEDVYSPIATPVSLPIALEGAQLPGVPKTSLTASLDYTRAVGSAWTWFSSVNGYYQSATRNAVQRSTTFNVGLPSFQLWGATTTLSNDQWDVSLFVKNIFNEEGITGLFSEAYMGTNPDEGYYGNGSKQFLSLPRTIGVSVGYKF